MEYTILSTSHIESLPTHGFICLLTGSQGSHQATPGTRDQLNNPVPLTTTPHLKSTEPLGQSYWPPWLSTTNAIIGVWLVLPKMKPVLSQRVWHRPHAATCSHTLLRKLPHMVLRRQRHDVTSLPGTTDVTSHRRNVMLNRDGKLTELYFDKQSFAR
jgi:hypothetical protein